MTTLKSTQPGLAALVLLMSAIGPAGAETLIGHDLNSSRSRNADIAALYAANRGSNGGGDQSLQFGDVLQGGTADDLLIGGLGIDILFGGEGDDVLIGGTEDFNDFNRDRAFGEAGDDTFIWSPGDGNDFFDGGEGTDVVILSMLGEQVSSTTPGEGTAPFFEVSAGEIGSKDFDGVFVNGEGDPVIQFFGSPGICPFVQRDESTFGQEVERLDLDALVGFAIESLPQEPVDKRLGTAEVEEELPEGPRDNGGRAAVHLRNVEFMVCRAQDKFTPEIIDLRQTPALSVDISQLPARAFRLVQDAEVRLRILEAVVAEEIK